MDEPQRRHSQSHGNDHAPLVGGVGGGQDDQHSVLGGGGRLNRPLQRKRTRMACDRCNISRTRCDGMFPCRRCQEYSHICHYNRQVKKRGRVPRKKTAATSDGAPSPASVDLEDQVDQIDSSPSYSTTVSDYSSNRPRLDDNCQEDRRQTRYGDQAETSPRYPALPYSRAVDAIDPSIHAGQQGSHMDADSQVSGIPSSHTQSSEFPPNIQRSPDKAPMHVFASLPSPGPFSPNGFEGVRIAGLQLTGQEHHEPETCRYRVLDPLLPYLDNILPVSLACELFEVYLVDPGTSFFRCASPYILTRVFRKKSLLHPTNPRKTSPALLATILWCCVQTAEIPALLTPGTRSKLIHSLYDLATFLTAERDPDRWRRIHGGIRVENDGATEQAAPREPAKPAALGSNEPLGSVDDVLTFILLCIGVSAGDFKSDSRKWWSKAARLTLAMGLNREDAPPEVSPQDTVPRHEPQQTLAVIEAQEERRRVFWLLFTLDRHLSLSYNGTLHIPDSRFDVYSPLSESVWENLDEISYQNLPRTLGPPTKITGAGYFEYFLPLMVILGDIIELHHMQNHPRLGGLDHSEAVTAVTHMIDDCESSLELLRQDFDTQMPTAAQATSLSSSDARRTSHGQDNGHDMRSLVEITYGFGTDTTHLRLVIAYSTHILHVLRVLLHGKWDAISMLDNEGDWITTPRFVKCATHAISASEAVSEILTLDPELTFMPYLFGIYLLHGSFILLLFADRMPQVGQNSSVEQACETIVRAHEVCVVTLSTEFQRNFRRVIRSTLYSVRGSTPAEHEEHKLARRQILSLYRWTKGSRGLGI